MADRRQFLQQAAGLCFVTCAGAVIDGCATAAARRETAISGKRVRTIDMHAHCAIPAAQAVAGEARLSRLLPQNVSYPGLREVAQGRLAAMDAHGIDMQVLSINPAWYGWEREVAEKVVEIQNEALASFCAAHPDRFCALASVTLQAPDLAITQLEKAVRRQGLRGVAVGASVAGAEFSDARFHPFWAKCEELGVVVFIHPASTPELANRLKGNGILANTIGNPLDTTIALSHLIFEGTLDRFPGLKILASHGGGFLGSYAPRSNESCRTFPEQCDKTITLRRKPSEYLRDIYVDNIVFTPEAMRHLGAEVGYDRIVLGTDYPYPWQPNAVQVALDAPGATEAQKRAMLGGTAAKLLGLKTDERQADG